MHKNIILFYSLLSLILTSCGEKSNQDRSTEIVKSSIIATTNKLWKKEQKLIVTFLDGDSQLKKMVERYSKEWTRYANVDFIFYDSVSLVPKSSVVNILITFKSYRNTSDVGTDSLLINKGTNEASMHLADLKGPKAINRFIILHEFGHALGLEHEHQHIKRNFTFDKEKTKEYYKKTYGFSEKETEMFILSTTEQGKNTYFSTYDPNSIMHYIFHSSITDQKLDFRQNVTLSLLDKIEIMKLYPGRISEKEIIESHNLIQEDNKKVEVVGNCKIEESVTEKMRLNDQLKPQLKVIKMYNAKSLVPFEYNSDFTYESKDDLIEFLKLEEYCSYSKDELQEIRRRISTENHSMKKVGNCEIPLLEDGKPVENSCSPSFQFQVLRLGRKERAINACFQSFKQAHDAMLASSFCNLSKTELEEYDNKERLAFEASLKKGKCSVEHVDSSQLAKNKKVVWCKDLPWFIAFNQEKMLNSACYSAPDAAITEINKNPECGN